MERFGEKLRRLRGDRPQKSVAEALEIPQTTLSSLEKQETIPRGDLLKKLADFYGIAVEYFYDTPEPQTSKPAREWLEHLRNSADTRDAIGTHSRDPLDAKTRKRVAETIKKIKEKHEETSDNDE